MNNPNLAIILGWNTRSEKRHAQAISKCKDFGFKQILKNIHIGKLRAIEKRDLLFGMKRIMNKKTDKIFSVTICESCFQALDAETKELLPELPDFIILD
jgi:hypothetical protein